MMHSAGPLWVMIVAVTAGLAVPACRQSATSSPTRAQTEASSASATAPGSAPAVTPTRVQGSASEPSPVVRIAAGDIQGISDGRLSVFKGVPYAAPPVGEGRWREPGPVAGWQGVRQTTTYGHACIQPPGLSEANGGNPGALSEDCLYLNIWTPTLDASAALPVMVWIHGGAFIFGSGAVPIYDGAPLARNNAVVITINYRLGLLGFFAHPALDNQRPGGPANFGLLDQIAALTWVQRNISQFGGDSRSVTILGQSAGGKSVVALFVSPLARGLFHRGIALSSPAIPDATRPQALSVGANVAQALGLTGGAATAAELRAVPADRLAQLKGRDLSVGPVPIAGDTVLPRSVQDTFAAAGEAAVPLIVGSVSDDASVVAAFGIDSAAVLKRLGVAGILVKALYPGVRDDRQVANQAIRDLIFTMNVRWIADRHSKLAPTWRYYFDYTAINDRTDTTTGVSHGAEVPYFLNTGAVFEGTRDTFTDKDREFARGVSGYVVEFARTGKPASAGHPQWPSYDARRDRTMVFGPETMAVQANFMRPRLNAFIGVVAILDRILTRGP